MTKQNEDELEILKEQVKPYITEPVMVHPVMIYGYGSSEGYHNSCLEMIPSGYELKSAVPCSGVFNRIFVTHDGYLTLCCQDFDRELIVANLNEMSLKDAWNSEKTIEIRERHICRDVKGLICEKCFYCTK